MMFCLGKLFTHTHPLAPMVLAPSLFEREGEGRLRTSG